MDPLTQNAAESTGVPTVLLVANQVTGFGYAWTHFENMYALMTTRIAALGLRTIVAFPKVTGEVAALREAEAQIVELDARPYMVGDVLAVGRFALRNNVRAIFFIDRQSLHPWSYGLLRLFGVRRIVVYNQTSGSLYRSPAVKRLIKWILARLRWMTPDVVVGVSDYVVRRERTINELPAYRLARVHNALAVPTGPPPVPTAHARLGVDPSRPLILTSCRAVHEKGVHHVFRAFDMLLSGWSDDRPRPVLAYVGAGPQLEELHTLRAGLAAGASIVMAGYRSDVADLIAGAEMCVVPSVWQEAFGYAVLDAMARGCAVIATRVGGIPEIIDSEAVGILVEPGDDAALAAAMRRVLDDGPLRLALGTNARQRARQAFDPGAQADRLVDLLAPDSLRRNGGSTRSRERTNSAQ